MMDTLGIGKNEAFVAVYHWKDASIHIDGKYIDIGGPDYKEGFLFLIKDSDYESFSHPYFIEDNEETLKRLKKNFIREWKKEMPSFYDDVKQFLLFTCLSLSEIKELIKNDH